MKLGLIAGSLVLLFGLFLSLGAQTSFAGTVQIKDDVHIELLPECLECANHSCEPNCFFNTTTMELVAIKPVKKGDELTFFYPSAEWDMNQAFQCNCGNKECVGNIKGAKYLSDAALKKYRFTDFIQSKLAARQLFS